MHQVSPASKSRELPPSGSGLGLLCPQLCAVEESVFQPCDVGAAGLAYFLLPRPVALNVPVFTCSL